jgi:hypothetical protein
MLEMDEAVLQQLVLPEKVFNRRHAWVRKVKQRACRSCRCGKGAEYGEFDSSASKYSFLAASNYFPSGGGWLGVLTSEFKGFRSCKV